MISVTCSGPALSHTNSTIIEPDGIFYTHVEPEDSVDIVTLHLQNGKLVERLFYRDPVTGQAGWYDVRVRVYKAEENEEKVSWPQFEPLKRVPGEAEHRGP